MKSVMKTRNGVVLYEVEGNFVASKPQEIMEALNQDLHSKCEMDREMASGILTLINVAGGVKVIS